MRARLKGWLVLGLFLSTAVYALAEDLTLTTYYPSPRGVYVEEGRVLALVLLGSHDDVRHFLKRA